MQVTNANEAIKIAGKILVEAGHNVYWITEARRVNGEWIVKSRTLAADVHIIIDANNGEVKELLSGHAYS